MQIKHQCCGRSKRRLRQAPPLDAGIDALTKHTFVRHGLFASHGERNRRIPAESELHAPSAKPQALLPALRPSGVHFDEQPGALAVVISPGPLDFGDERGRQ